MNNGCKEGAGNLRRLAAFSVHDIWWCEHANEQNVIIITVFYDNYYLIIVSFI